MNFKEIGSGINPNVTMLMSMCIYMLESHANTWKFSSYGAFKRIGTNQCSFRIECKNHDEMLIRYVEHDPYSNPALSILLSKADHTALCPEIFIKLPTEYQSGTFINDLASNMVAIETLLSIYQSGTLLAIIREAAAGLREANDGKSKVLEFEFEVTDKNVLLKLTDDAGNNEAKIIDISTFKR